MTLGDNLFIDVGARIDGQIHRLSSKSSEEIREEMNLKEIVPEDDVKEEQSEQVVRDWDEKNSSEHEGVRGIEGHHRVQAVHCFRDIHHD